MPATVRPAALAAAVALLLAAGAAPAAAQGISWGKKLKGIIKEQATTRIEKRLAEETGRGTEKAMEASVSAVKCLATEAACRALAAARDTARVAGGVTVVADSTTRGVRGAAGPAVPGAPAAVPAAPPAAPAGTPRQPAQAAPRG